MPLDDWLNLKQSTSEFVLNYTGKRYASTFVETDQPDPRVC